LNQAKADLKLLEVGRPVSHGSLTIVPIYLSEIRNKAEYVTLDEAVRRGWLEIAEIEAKKSVVETERAFRVQQAEWTAEANKAEERAKVAGEISRMEEMKVLEARRVDANRLKYEAEVVIPAEAEKEARMKRATGEAAFHIT
jgi:hypothetical protein